MKPLPNFTSLLACVVSFGMPPLYTADEGCRKKKTDCIFGQLIDYGVFCFAKGTAHLSLK